MSMNSLLADTLARLRNAQLARKSFTLVKSSNFVRSVLDVLEKEGYIDGYQEATQENGLPIIKVDLKYYQGEPVISELKMISKPGRRVYEGLSDLPKSRGGLGIYILSTSKGVISDFEARNLNVGGEILCRVC